MDYSQTINEINQEWFQKWVTLDKKEISYISNKETFRTRLVGFMTSSYFKRSQLIKEGDILFAYSFKEWTNEVRKEIFDYPTWIIFSPEKKINENPEILKEIAARVLSLCDGAPSSKEEKNIKKLVTEYLSDCSYVEISSSLTGGELAYLSIIYRHLTLNSEFHLGLNLIIANQSLSSEVIYLPEKYWNESFKKAYLNNEFI